MTLRVIATLFLIFSAAPAHAFQLEFTGANSIGCGFNVHRVVGGSLADHLCISSVFLRDLDTGDLITCTAYSQDQILNGANFKNIRRQLNCRKVIASVPAIRVDTHVAGPDEPGVNLAGYTEDVATRQGYRVWSAKADGSVIVACIQLALPDPSLGFPNVACITGSGNKSVDDDFIPVPVDPNAKF